MSFHYNVVISLNFKTEEREEYLKLYENQKGFSILHKGTHTGDIFQKIITKQDRSLFK